MSASRLDPDTEAKIFAVLWPAALVLSSKNFVGTSYCIKSEVALEIAGLGAEARGPTVLYCRQLLQQQASSCSVARAAIPFMLLIPLFHLLFHQNTFRFRQFYLLPVGRAGTK